MFAHSLSACNKHSSYINRRSMSIFFSWFQLSDIVSICQHVIPGTKCYTIAERFLVGQVVQSSLWEIQLLFRHHVGTPGVSRSTMCQWIGSVMIYVWFILIYGTGRKCMKVQRTYTANTGSIDCRNKSIYYTQCRSTPLNFLSMCGFCWVWLARGSCQPYRRWPNSLRSPSSRQRTGRATHLPGIIVWVNIFTAFKDV